MQVRAVALTATPIASCVLAAIAGGIKTAVLPHRREAVTRANLPFRFFAGSRFVRRQDLLKPDIVSELILLGAGTLIFLILILILVVALTQASALG